MDFPKSDSAAQRLEPWLRGFFFAAGTALLALVVLSVVLVRRGEAAMKESDRAFHAGELRIAGGEAKAAGLADVPGSEHVAEATARLEAIARGAAAEGRWDLARLSWDALRLLDEQTDYPGRGPTASGERAKVELGHLRAAGIRK